MSYEPFERRKSPEKFRVPLPACVMDFIGCEVIAGWMLYLRLVVDRMEKAHSVSAPVTGLYAIHPSRRGFRLRLDRVRPTANHRRFTAFRGAFLSQLFPLTLRA